MDDHDPIAPAGAERVLRLELTVRLDRQPIEGCLRTEQGTEELFVGWLGFIDALERLPAGAGDDGTR